MGGGALTEYTTGSIAETAKRSEAPDATGEAAWLAEVQRIARLAGWSWDVAEDRVTWSAEFYEMLGMRPGSVSPTLNGFLDRIHPDDRAAAEGALRRALERGEEYAVAHRLIRADGEQRMMLCRGEVHRDSDGTPLRMVGASLDLTEFMGFAEDIRTSHDHLVAAEEVAGTGSFEWNVEADVVSWSAGLYRIFGLRPDEFDGTLKGYLLRVHPDDRDERAAELRRLLESGDELVSEHRIRRGDGAVRRLRSRVAIERDESGRPLRLIGVCSELSD